MSDVKIAKFPSNLGTSGRALWREIAGQVAQDGLVLDAREAVLLTLACRETDQLAIIEDALVGASLMVRGSQGQEVAHPLIGEARRSRTTIAALLGRIGLDDPLAAAGPGKGSRTTPGMARGAANSRHHGSVSGIGGAS